MTRYRFPEALGGQEHESAAGHGDTIGFDLDGIPERFWLAREILMEVKPPSIDDPAPFPWECVDPDEDTLRIDAPNRRDFPAYVRIEPSNAVYLTADQCREAARVLWQRADAWEASNR